MLQFLMFIILVVNFTTVNLQSTNSSFNPVVINAKYGQSYPNLVNISQEFILIYNENNSTESSRINVESNATSEEPLLVVVKQRKGILSWQIPLLVERKNSVPHPYNKTSRTLCSPKYYQSKNQDLTVINEYLIVSISTGSSDPVYFNVSVTPEKDFSLILGESRSIEISASEPKYYSYHFSNQVQSQSILVKVESNSDTCMTLSIQNATCPVFDLERNIEYSEYWQTVSQLGGITIRKDIYPNGFFVVLDVKGDDMDCTGQIGAISRNKTITLSLISNISVEEGIRASAIALSIGVIFCSIYIISVLTHNARMRRKLRQLSLNESTTPLPHPEDILTPSVIEEAGPSMFTSVDEDSSLDEDDIDLLDDAFSDKEIIRTKRVLSVSDLARKEPKILRHKSRLYLYYLGTIAIFYALPVVQVVATYQYILDVTGNQDLCYYNFLCSHPFFWFSDFNHIFSNFAYLLLGLLFIMLTYVREKADAAFEEKKKSYGIPQHYGLFYAMGTALMMEGVLSACYHVCPNHSNFQFDTSFMYIISVLCMVKIYQNRHPDINARASVTFAVLALTIFLGMVGVLNGSDSFWIVFTILHLLTCLSVTAQIYYMGRFKFNRGLLSRVTMTLKHDARSSVRDIFKPLYAGRLILLMIANFCNIGLAVYGNMHHKKDFATFLLAILMFNLLLYTFFYIVMKLCYREKILPHAICYIILSFTTWGFALYYFINKSVSWSLMPAQSRHYNMPCKLLNFFDFHDIWHFLSALAMFFSFMVLLTLDDDLEDTHRSQIPVF